jgi:hypothetical protein
VNSAEMLEEILQFPVTISNKAWDRCVGLGLLASVGKLEHLLQSLYISLIRSPEAGCIFCEVGAESKIKVKVIVELDDSDKRVIVVSLLDE